MISVALLSGVDDAEQDALLLRMAFKAMGLTTVSVVQTYRRTVHDWFPVVSDDQFSHFLDTHLLPNCPAIDGMLVLAMGLVAQPPCTHQSHGICNSLYKAVKQSFRQVRALLYRCCRLDFCCHCLNMAMVLIKKLS